MIIEDQELRGLFKSESEEHLQLLDEGLLRLEANPTDIGILEELFRSAHSLKGAARMLGLQDVEKVTHWFESVLGSAKDRAVSLTSDAVSRMYHSVSVIQRLVSHAITGEPSGVDVEQVLRWLDDKGTTGSAETAAAAAAPEKSEADSPDPSPGSNKLPTIRVEQRKLDALMTHAGELIVTKTRLVRRTGQLDELMSLWEECNRSRQGENLKKFGELLHKLREDIGEDTARLDYTVSRVDEGVRDVRLLPLSTVFNVFRRMVRDIAKAQNKEVQLVIQGGETVADKRILEEMKDPIMHMIRNAVDHGIEPPAEREAHGKPRSGTIRLGAFSRGSNIILELSDDGRGLNEASIKATALKRKVAPQE
jgi:two-component system, chemotaxis family, sensor kinase CheA